MVMLAFALSPYERSQGPFVVLDSLQGRQQLGVACAIEALMAAERLRRFVNRYL
jgi:hypothetical protein